MNTPVYAECITSLSDARYFSGMGVRWLGICVNPLNPAYLSPERFREIAGWVSGPAFVIEAEGLGDDFDAAGLSSAYGVSFFRVRENQIKAVQGFDFGLDLRTGLASVPNEAAFVIFQSPDALTSGGGQMHLVMAPADVSDADVLLSRFPGTGFVVAGSAEQAVGLKEYDAREFLEYLDNLH